VCKFLENLEKWEIDGCRPLAVIEFEQEAVGAVRRLENLLAWRTVTDAVVQGRLAEIAVALWFRQAGKWVSGPNWYKGNFEWAPSDLAVNVAGNKREVEVKSGPHASIATFKAIAHPARPFTEPGMPRIGDYLVGVSMDGWTAVIWGAVTRERLETVPMVLSKHPPKTAEHDWWYSIPLDWFEPGALTELRKSAS